jgi:hypothetical protein
MGCSLIFQVILAHQSAVVAVAAVAMVAAGMAAAAIIIEFF